MWFKFAFPQFLPIVISFSPMSITCKKKYGIWLIWVYFCISEYLYGILNRSYHKVFSTLVLKKNNLWTEMMTGTVILRITIGTAKVVTDNDTVTSSKVQPVMGHRTQEAKVLMEKLAISVLNTSWEKPWKKPERSYRPRPTVYGLKMNPLSTVSSYEMLP